ncbi:hypothetical protein B9Z55_017428 [Caenorhabditis nigoni]|uniref:Sugar phosphate transporter domain-containing protein n=1 Tax=Caenorhabditis nigoni TaxID=1611254 RepID=A0A2G5T9P1_9PELO|nr:hypothetical protein B9Z55_017428 [Caenorhabditis nigoni]
MTVSCNSTSVPHSDVENEGSFKASGHDNFDDDVAFRRKTMDEQNIAENKSTAVVIFTHFAIVALVAITWCLTTQFSKIALSFDKENFNAPYFMMWFNTNLMLLCFPVYVIVDKIRSRRSVGDIVGETFQTFGKKKGFSIRNMFVYVTPFVFFWVGANYPYVRALLLITPSVATSISACNAAFFFSVALAIGGVAVISFDNEMKIEWLGILLSFLSAFTTAVYKVSFKKIIGNASLGDVSLFMTCLGFLNLIINWIPLLILALTGAETLHFAYAPWGPMVGAALLSIIGMLLGIPLNILIDIIFRSLDVTTLF